MRRNKLILVIAYFSAVALASEGITYLAGRVLKDFVVGVDFTPVSKIYEDQKAAIHSKLGQNTNTMFDADLGWRYRSNFRSGPYNNNALGLRGTTDYSVKPRDGVLRIAAFGDSFVYGNEANDSETWTAQLEAMMPGLEVFNSGVGGYGTDQAYLMYKKYGRQYNAHVVLIGFTTVQLPRNVNVYRRFFSSGEIMFVKPRFILKTDGSLELVASPIQSESDYLKYYSNPSLIIELGKHDFWYQPLVYENPLYDYSNTVRLVSQTLTMVNRTLVTRNNIVTWGQLNRESEAFEITTKLLRLFCGEVRADRSVPIVLLFPDAYRLGAKGGGENVRAYHALVEYLQKEGLEYLDLAAAFEKPVTIEKHFMPGGHYSPVSNTLIARAIAAYLVRRGLIYADGTRRIARLGDS